MSKRHHVLAHATARRTRVLRSRAAWLALCAASAFVLTPLAHAEQHLAEAAAAAFDHAPDHVRAVPDGERVQPADALAFEEFLLAQGAPAQPAAAGPLATYELDLAERTHVHEHAGPHAPGAHSHAPGAPHGHSHGPGQSHGSGALQHFAAALESTLALPAYALELPQFAPPAVEQPQTLTLPSWLRPARSQAPPRV